MNDFVYVTKRLTKTTNALVNTPPFGSILQTAKWVRADNPFLIKIIMAQNFNLIILLLLKLKPVRSVSAFKYDDNDDLIPNIASRRVTEQYF